MLNKKEGVPIVCVKASPWIRAWIAAALLALIPPDAYRSQSGLPNLRPHEPQDWSDTIVVSNVEETHTDSPALRDTDDLYVDAAFINSGGSSTAGEFVSHLFVNDRRWRIKRGDPLEPGFYTWVEDLSIGRLSIGTHTLRLVVDAEDSVRESNERDNEYTRTITVSGCYPLTTGVQPQGAGTIMLSQAPTCSAAAVGLGAPAGRGDGDGPQQPGKLFSAAGTSAGDQVQRARAFAALADRAQAKGRVSVIVGLRTEGRVGASAKSSFKDSATRAAWAARVAGAQRSLLARMSGHNISSVKRFKHIPYVAIVVDAAALEALASDSDVISIEEDRLLKPMLKESTPLVGAPQAWSRGFSGSGQAIAILDDGVDKDHFLLSDKVVSEACYSGWGRGESLCPGGVTESTRPGSGMPCSAPDLPECSHGTHVAGIAAGNDPRQHGGLSGVARDANLISIQVFSKFESDDCADEEEDEESDEPCIRSVAGDVLSGLERVLELGDRFDIAAVNMSLAVVNETFPGDCDIFFPAWKAAIDNLQAVGIATIVASGNEESAAGIGAPACISSAVSVGSTDDGGSLSDGSSETTRDAVSDFSNSSPALDLLAPGRWITSARPEDRPDPDPGTFPIRTSSGTSAAAPHVAGAWAVLKSKGPHASVEQVLSALKNTGVPITDPRNDITIPRIQIDAALSALEPQPRFSYTPGTRLTLTANPNPGFRLKRWRGCDSVSGNRCTVTMNSVRNVAALFEPAGGEPDLLITSLTGPSTAAAGTEVSVVAGIRNQGPAGAGPFRLDFLLLTADTSNSFPLAHCDYGSGLEAGQSLECGASAPLPAPITPGTYFLEAIVDAGEQVTESNEYNNTRLADSEPITVLPAITSSTFVPVVLTAAGRKNSFFTSELTLTNRGDQPATLTYAYTAHIGGGSGTATGVLAPGKQQVKPDALGFLRNLGIPIPGSGNRIGTLRVEASGSSEVGVVVRTTTAVPEGEGRAGLAYPGVAEAEGFEEAVYLCGLRQNRKDRSNVAFQNMGTPEDGSITLRTTVFSGDGSGSSPQVLEDVTLGVGGFHQYSGVLGRVANGYVQVERVAGTAPFYAYGVINDQANSDGSFVFPMTASSLTGIAGQTLPVIVKTGVFTSELMVTNFSEAAKTVDFSFVADGVETPDHTARFHLTLEAGQQRIMPDIVGELRSQGVAGIGPSGTYAGAVFATAASGDLSGVVIGARTGSEGGGGRYSVFYNAVPQGAAFTGSAWVEALQQNRENRSNLALVNTGEVDGSESVFNLDIYDGQTGMLTNTVTGIRLAARRWHQINGILGNYAPGTTQGYVRITKISGNNPFLAYGVINDGGAPGQRSDDGAYLPARE